jgi:hypothetical protein
LKDRAKVTKPVTVERVFAILYGKESPKKAQRPRRKYNSLLFSFVFIVS